MSIVDGSRKEVTLGRFEVVIVYTVDIMFICTIKRLKIEMINIQIKHWSPLPIEIKMTKSKGLGVFAKV